MSFKKRRADRRRIRGMVKPPLAYLSKLGPPWRVGQKLFWRNDRTPIYTVTKVYYSDAAGQWFIDVMWQGIYESRQYSTTRCDASKFTAYQDS